MMRILYKMKTIEHPAWTINKAASVDMYRIVNEMRHYIWDAYIYSNTGHRLDSVLAGKIVMELLSLTTSIDEKLVEVNFKDKSELRPWATFKMMLNFIHLFSSSDV